jgi:hypothetical protein
MSGVVEKATTSADCPLSTARLWAPDAPYDSLNETPLPAVVWTNCGIKAS